MNENTYIEQLSEATDLRNNGREVDAIEIYSDLLDKLPEDDVSKRGFICEEIGVCYRIMNDTEKAIEWYKKAIDYFKNSQDFVGLGNVQRDMGRAYAYKGDFQKELEWLNESEQTLLKTDNLTSLGITQIKRGTAYTNMEDYKKAEKHLMSGLENIRKDASWNWFMEMTALLELGFLYFRMAAFQKGIDRLRESLALLYEEDKTRTQMRRLGEIYLGLAWCYLGLEKISVATDRFIQAMNAWEPMDAASTQLVIEKGKVEELIQQIEEANEELGAAARQAYEDIL